MKSHSKPSAFTRHLACQTCRVIMPRLGAPRSQILQRQTSCGRDGLTIRELHSHLVLDAIDGQDPFRRHPFTEDHAAWIYVATYSCLTAHATVGVPISDT
jgi:hypothetical protein